MVLVLKNAVSNFKKSSNKLNCKIVFDKPKNQPFNLAGLGNRFCTFGWLIMYTFSSFITPLASLWKTLAKIKPFPQ